MTKLFISIIFLQVFFNHGVAQKEIDSLKKIFPFLYDSAQVDCLNALSYSYTEISKKDSAYYYAGLAYKEAGRLHYTHGIAEAISQQAELAKHFENNFPKEEKLAEEALSWYNKTSNKKDISNTYDRLAFALFSQSYYDASLYWTMKAYQYDKKIGDEYDATDEIGGFAAYYIEKGDYEKGFYFAEQFLKLASQFKNQVQIDAALITIGQLYLRIEDYSAAINYYRQVLQNLTHDDLLFASMNEADVFTQMEFAEIYCHLHQFDSALYRYNLFDSAKAGEKDLRVFLESKGEYYLSQKQYDNALKNFLKALYYHRKLNDRNEIMRVLIDIAETYLAKGDFITALQYGKQGLNMALETNAKQFIRDGYKILYSVYDRLGNTDSAYLHYQKYISVRDMVLNDEMKGKFAAYNYEQKIALLNNEEQLQQQKLEQSAQQKKFLIIGIVGVFLSGTIILRNVLLKRKNEKLRLENELRVQKLENQQQLSELEMQALRSQMNPHFVFNCLSSINRFILKNKTEEASDYLTKFSRLIRMVLNNSKQSYISLEDELETLGLYLEMEKLRFKNSFDYTFTFGNSVDLDNIFIPPLLLQPFAENAIWHGLMHLPAGQAGKQEKGFLNFDFSVEDRFLSCIITDNGVGREQAELLKSKSAEKRKSMGLKITTERLSLLNNNSSEQTFFTIEDLTDENRNATGTRVYLKIYFKQMMER
jgi:tetratricopeptide (TPR) repeat protein